ncbi:MAG: glycosyltransferase family 2 protein [Acutalibacteraceae bacterium]
MISVVIAAYNGGKYIKAQLDSVLSQLSDGDEVVISDDLPEGDTFDVVKEYLDTDKRVRYIKGPGKGVIKNFENAVSVAQGDYIFLCDQDDVWLPGKVDAVMKEFQNGATVVMHDAKITDADLNVTDDSFFELMGTKKGIVKNIIKNTYIGCCMAFSANLRPYILPFPDDIPMHDQWIGLIGEKYGEVALINEPYILYRRHGATVTGGSTTLKQKIMWRAAIIRRLHESRLAYE